ncbi:hypothetical protein MN116_003122 [Schistosoma mekongi]|uniref:Uncharacterized protein n=1 Tax=Schistosoma mekongi TaxID=38744 RepID=A0AAE2D8A5_SCHME|nr:hypothetical protein MN116_003122 [Schistosoma mekongi]
MPSLSENSKHSYEKNISIVLSQSQNYLSSNDNVFPGNHAHENQMDSKYDLPIKEAGNILPRGLISDPDPRLMYSDGADDLYNQLKQRMCELKCRVCDSEEILDSVHEQNNGFNHTHKKQNSELPHQQDYANKNGLLNKKINELTEQDSRKTKWIEKCKEFENEINELRRARDKAICQNIKYEEQITELKSKLNSKQEKIHNLLNELEHSNQRLNETETRFNAYKTQTNQNEKNYQTLSRELMIIKQCKEQAEQNAKNCENNRLLYERRMKELDNNYEQSKQRYYEDVQGLMSQLDIERSRADELLQKIEYNRRQSEERFNTIEQTHQKKLNTLLEEGQKELKKQLAVANEQIKEQQLKISNQELEISTIESDKNELMQINKKSTDEQLKLREQIKLIEHLLTLKDQDISMIQLECRLYADKLKQIELEKNHFIEKEKFIKQKYQNKAKRAWEQCQTIRTRLNRRLVQLRYSRDLLSKHLRKQYEQMNRLNNLFWETGWAYVQSQNCLHDINKQEKEHVNEEIQTTLFTNKIKQSNATIDQIVQTDVIKSGDENKDDTVISCAISWISNDLDNLTGTLEKLLKCQGTEKWSNLDLHNKGFHVGLSEKVSLISLILGLKGKVNWLRKCCNQLTGYIFSQNTELPDRNDLNKLGNVKKNFEDSTRNLKLLLSQMETDALEDELSCVGQLAQTTANQLKLSHLRLEENLDSIRTDLIRLKAECH